MARKLLKILLWICAVPFALLMLLTVLLYIPFVQDAAVRYATEAIGKSTGMTIGIDRLRLVPPLRLRVDGVSVIEAGGDTMLTAGSARVGVAILPLLRGSVKVDDLGLDDVYYQLGNADSLMWLRANVKRALIPAVNLGISSNSVDICSADLQGVRVNLRMLPDTAVAPVDTAAAAPWIIRAGLIRLRDVDYTMSMLPTIDSLGVHVPEATLREATVDMASYLINGRSLTIDSVSAAYIYPAVTPDASPVASAVSSDSVPAVSPAWTIRADSLRLTGREVLYAQSGVSNPAPGLDMGYIALSDISIAIDSLYNRGTSLRVPLRELALTERCGLSLRADGLVRLDSTSVSASDFTLSTLRSTMRINADMGMGELSTVAATPLSVSASGVISPADIAQAFPDMRTLLSPIEPISFNVLAEGSSATLDIPLLSVDIPRLARLRGEGSVTAPFDPDAVGAHVTLDGSVPALSDRTYSFLPIAHIPALSLKTDVDYLPGQAQGDLAVTTAAGHLAADGSWTARREDYDLTLSLVNFPVGEFMPELGVGTVTARAEVDGRGYNPMARTTSIDANVILADATYQGVRYSDLILRTTLHAGAASASLTSHNPGADAMATLDATIAGDSIDYHLDLAASDIDLYRLHITDTVCGGSFNLSSQGFYNLASQDFDVSAALSSLRWKMPDITIAPSSPISLVSRSAASGSLTTVSQGDLSVNLSTPRSLLAMIDSLPPAMTTLSGQIDSMRISVPALSHVLPSLSLSASMGRDNFVADYLASSASPITIGKASAALTLLRDSTINLSASATSIASGSTHIDTLSLSAHRRGDYLLYDISMNNRPGTWDDFAHVAVNGFVGANRLSTFLRQNNIKGENGFTLGFNTSVADSVVTVHLVPGKPTIAYKPWKINLDNYITYDIVTRHLDADVSLSGDDSSVRIFTEHPGDDTDEHSDSTAHHIHSHAFAQEDLVIRLTRIHLADWLSINPFAPPVKGDVSADLRLNYANSVLTGKGSVSLDDLYYGRDRVGDFDLNLDIANSPGGKVMADVTLMIDSIPTITARGVVGDSTLTTPFLLDFRMIRFPLATINPFMPPATASLSGVLNGDMVVTGDMANPVFNGELRFDSAAVKVNMMGTTFRFSDTNIPVDSNVVTFRDFAITGANDNPLKINGTVDARHLTDIRIDLDAAARNMQILRSDRARGGASLYGRAFIDLFAAVKGNLNRLTVQADASLLSASNLTYVVSDVEQTLTEGQTEEMVHFVQFNDTAAVHRVDSIATASTMALVVNADLHLQQGSTINVDLNPSGTNRVQIKPQGDLDYSLSPLNGQRLTGRLNIPSGYVRYTPPLMSEKNFSFSEGSYIAFNGDVLNPVLNIHAVDVVRSNVTTEGQNSRLVNFDVMLGVTGTFNAMNVNFDLSTNDDITVQNQLSSMSAEQRANQAMNLLLYNVYTGAGGTKGTTVAGNPLFSFITSQLNTWAANNIRGVDISFGIDQYDRTYEGATTTATSYSYRVSKSLFDDRFKIVVGGNYSTDANTDENFSQNLINDISFEYLLNRAGTMYVRIFRHTGYESILEGEVTKTGVGFVYKRRLGSLYELLRPGAKRFH